MTFFKELFTLIGMLFHNIRTNGVLEPVIMRHFPFKGYEYMMWCDTIVTRKQEFMIPEVKESHERKHLYQALFNYKKWYQYKLAYLREWFKTLVKGNLSVRTAYHCNPFEIEAKGKESQPEYKVGKDTWKKYRIKKPRSTYKTNRRQWKLYCEHLVREVER